MAFFGLLEDMPMTQAMFEKIFDIHFVKVQKFLVKLFER